MGAVGGCLKNPRRKKKQLGGGETCTPYISVYGSLTL